MKFYTDNNKVIMVQTAASANTFVSSIVSNVKKYILGAFPKNYFKYIYTDTADTFQEYNKGDTYNKSLHKIIYPSLTITPSLSTDNPVTGLKNILMSSPSLWLPRDINRVYPILLADPDDKYQIYTSSDYIAMNLKFRIAVNSFVQATNAGYWLKSRFDDNIFKYLDGQHIQVEVPKALVNAIAKIENLFGSSGDEITNQEDLEKLDKLLLQIGMRDKPIIRKKSLNTNKYCYFFEEKENLLTLFKDLDIPESISRENGVEAEYELTFSIQISAWWPNAFIMIVDKAAYQEISTLITDATNTDTSGTGFYSTSIGTPVALDRKKIINFKDSTGAINVGMNVLHQTFTFDSNSSIKKINLQYLLQPDLLKLHAFAVDNNYDITQFIYILARTATDYNSGEIGTVDYNNLYIDFSQDTNTDIVLDVFVNRAMFDTLGELMESDTFYKNDYALTTMIVNYYDDDETLNEYSIRVYAFADQDEYYSTDVSKALRIYTPYGIGYIGLVMEGEANASPYKVCLGTDKYGNNIIRCFELAK